MDEPVTCRVSSVTTGYGKSNCKWSSCKEGCTADMYVCYQVRIQYSRQKYMNGTSAADIDDWVDLTQYDDVSTRQVARLL